MFSKDVYLAKIVNNNILHNMLSKDAVICILEKPLMQLQINNIGANNSPIRYVHIYYILLVVYRRYIQLELFASM